VYLAPQESTHGDEEREERENADVFFLIALGECQLSDSI